MNILQGGYSSLKSEIINTVFRSSYGGVLDIGQFWLEIMSLLWPSPKGSGVFRLVPFFYLASTLLCYAETKACSLEAAILSRVPFEGLQQTLADLSSKILWMLRSLLTVLACASHSFLRVWFFHYPISTSLWYPPAALHWSTVSSLSTRRPAQASISTVTVFPPGRVQGSMLYVSNEIHAKWGREQWLRTWRKCLKMVGSRQAWAPRHIRKTLLFLTSAGS